MMAETPAGEYTGRPGICRRATQGLHSCCQVRTRVSHLCTRRWYPCRLWQNILSNRSPSQATCWRKPFSSQWNASGTANAAYGGKALGLPPSLPPCPPPSLPPPGGLLLRRRDPKQISRRDDPGPFTPGALHIAPRVARHGRRLNVLKYV